MTPSEIGRAIRAYMSEECAFCGEQKHRRKDPFCQDYIYRLPEPLLEQLNRKEDYIAAFGRSWDFLFTIFG